ncbi:MFS transporter [Staphylococcus shinii]|uniref:MFS transporter n=1 Tax=Staphylococcus shinii TaxID=2912228 RepID=A0A418IFY9_9STAP|nr:MFS transporter [Staphylococcus shinii]MDW8563778.1 MFS transporter [Staphylococcus shinii]MDW8567018.1 MFS transporter [Staphylococcus shinii]RIN01122.1 MFS transporter [Staphylococcus shinii]RIN04435.1 MFS transporter [Staphylococcus shinii]
MNIKKWIILCLVSSALFLIVIDMTVLYTALPLLTHDLEATATQKLWIVNAYALVVAGLLPGLGTLGDYVGYKKMFLLGLVIFGGASLLAASATTPTVLIMARVLLAIGAATMMPSTLSIIKLTFKDYQERALALGIWSAITAAGAGLGPVIGGLLLEKFSWPSVFIINIPIVIIVLIISYILIPQYPTNKDGSWDFISSFQIMVGLITVVFAIKELAKPDNNLVVLFGAFAIGLIAITMFIRRQNRLKFPLINLAIFKNPYFTGGTIVAITTSFILMGLEYILSQRLQLVLGLTPLNAGLIIMMMALASLVGAILIGIILTKFGTLKLQWVTLLLAFIGISAFYWVLHAHLAIQIITLIVIGLGLGSAMTLASNAIMSNTDDKNSGMAASIEEVSFEFGGSLGIAILGGLFSVFYSLFFNFNNNSVDLSKVKGSLDETLIQAEQLPLPISKELIDAGKTAYDDAFSLIIIISILSLAFTIILLIWMDLKHKRLPE